MYRLLIIGAGGHGKSIAEAVHLSSSYEISGFLDDSWPERKFVWSYPIHGKVQNLDIYRDLADYAIVALGNNEIRKKITLELINVDISIATIIHPKAIVSPSARIGAGSTIMAGAVIGTNSILGEGVIINCGAVVDHDCHLGDFSHLGVNVSMAGGSSIGENAWLQAGSALGYKAAVSSGTTIPPCTSVILPADT